MGEVKHTPGPWEALPDYTHGPVVVDADQSIVADYTAWDGLLAEAKANAHLVAAAPEMKEALEVLINRISTGVPVSWGELNDAHRALAKANGETPQ